MRKPILTSYVEHPQAGTSPAEDAYVRSGASTWLSLGLRPIITVTPWHGYIEWALNTPGAILGLKIGNALRGFTDLAGWQDIGKCIEGLPGQEIRLENETLMQSVWKSASDPDWIAFADCVACLPTSHKYVWMTAFFNPFAAGVPTDRTHNRQKKIAKVFRAIHPTSRYMIAQLAKRPKRLAPDGKTYVKNNDWWNDSAAAAAAPYCDSTHVPVCHVYSEAGYGVHTNRFWRMDEYGIAKDAASNRNVDLTFDCGYKNWDNADEQQAWKKALAVYTPPDPTGATT